MARRVRLLYSDVPEGFQDCKSGIAVYFEKLKHTFQRLSVPVGFPDTTMSLKTVYSANLSNTVWAGFSVCPCIGRGECTVSYERMRANAPNLKLLKTAPAHGLCLYCFEGPECCPAHKK